ncbi:MAG: hypothetical protein L0210_11140 [Rhodospirillales bacterium]|nr:hypothetical protein [Rhodospirillales bacterium]
MDDSDDQEANLAEAEETARRKSLLQSALRDLTGREHHIVLERWLSETPATLRLLSRHYGLSSERIRQIEARALVKLRCSVRVTDGCGMNV